MKGTTKKKSAPAAKGRAKAKPQAGARGKRGGTSPRLGRIMGGEVAQENPFGAKPVSELLEGLFGGMPPRHSRPVGEPSPEVAQLSGVLEILRSLILARDLAAKGAADTPLDGVEPDGRLGRIMVEVELGSDRTVRVPICPHQLHAAMSSEVAIFLGKVDTLLAEYRAHHAVGAPARAN